MDMASGREPFEARVAVDLDDALEVLQMAAGRSARRSGL
jgi:hypothetical protein